jgi:hypothetical protein
MKWIIAGSGSTDLTPWEGRPFSPGVEAGPGERDNRDNHERIVAWESAGMPEELGVCRRLADAILRFDVFPPEMVTPVIRRSPVQVGDPVGVRYHFAPGLDFFFASRVIERFDRVEDGWWRAGFVYRTLAGHPELGEEVFCVEKNLATGEVRVALRSWSRPGTRLAWLGYPLVRRLQLRAGRAALDHLESLARHDTPRLLEGAASHFTHRRLTSFFPAD